MEHEDFEVLVLALESDQLHLVWQSVLERGVGFRGVW